MSLTTEPQLEIPDEQELEYYGTSEDSDLLYQAKNYLERIKKDKILGKRHIKVWAQDLKNDSYFLSRFIRAGGLKPPFDKGGPQDIERAARYVSLVPFKLENENFKDVPDSFMNCQQFLDIKGGDFEEHAALLCNYFNYIDADLGGDHAYYKSYVVLGNAVPEGETFFVVRRSIKKDQLGCVEIWNPQTGDPYVMKTELRPQNFMGIPMKDVKQTVIDENDRACPLHSVGCVFDHSNVYINIQKEGAPEQIDWDIDNPKLWKPYLDDLKKKKYFGSVDIPSIQPEQIVYEITDEQKVSRLQKSIESYLMKKIENSRDKKYQGTTFDTKFRRDVSEQIRNNVVKSCEAIRYNHRLSGQSSILGVDKDLQKQSIIDFEKICKKLEQACDKAERKLYGFPINFAFTDYEKIWQEIEATDICSILRNNIEFVLAVECFQSKSYIISVWVFIAVLFNED